MDQTKELKEVKLVELITESGYKKKHLANELGYSPAYFSFLVNNPKQFKYEKLLDLFELIKIDPKSYVITDLTSNFF